MSVIYAINILVIRLKMSMRTFLAYVIFCNLKYQKSDNFCAGIGRYKSLLLKTKPDIL